MNYKLSHNRAICTGDMSNAAWYLKEKEDRKRKALNRKAKKRKKK